MHFDVGGDHRRRGLIGQHLAKAAIKPRGAMAQRPAQRVGQAWELPNRWQARDVNVPNAHFIGQIINQRLCLGEPSRARRAAQDVVHAQAQHGNINLARLRSFHMAQGHRRGVATARRKLPVQPHLI